MLKQKLNIDNIPKECNLSHNDTNYNFAKREIHERCCDQCRHACTNGFYAPSMWCVKHKTNDGLIFIKEYGGTGCDDFEEGNIWDYYEKNK